MTARPTDDTDPVVNDAGGKVSRNSRLRRVLTALLKYAVPPVITVGLCWLLLRDTDLRSMWLTICRDCDFRWIMLDVACLVGAMVARAARWQIQLKALHIKAPLGMLTLSVFGTYAVNMVFPRLGEVWRTGFVAARCRSPFTTVFGSMVADRLTDTVAVGLISLLAFALAGPQLVDFLNSDTSKFHSLIALAASPWLWAVVLLLAALTAWLLLGRSTWAPVRALRRVVRGLWDGFAVIGSMPGKGLWLLYTVLLWNCYFWGLWAVFESFPLLSELLRVHGLTALLVGFVFTSLSMLVPSAGGIGPWQWAMVFALSFYMAEVPGLDREYVITFSNLALGVQTVCFVLLGILTFLIIAFTPSHNNTRANDFMDR
ncbi:MAG: flippase-like domain-containing protein [Duncaniella sp.]|nr:flippase-like domain-containing protein [Duncaniella sp.]